MVEKTLILLCSLVGSAISGSPFAHPDSLKDLDAEEWDALLKEAVRQSVTGLLYAALQGMSSEIQPPESFFFRLAALSYRIEKKSRQMEEALHCLMEQFRSKGLAPMPMKGARTASWYPVPSLREYGDIDLYLPVANLTGTLQAAGFEVEQGPDGSAGFLFEGIRVDVHTEYYDILCRDLPEPGSPLGEMFMISTHALRHAIGTGIGLRQICDIAAASMALAFDKSHLHALFARSGLSSWEALTNAFLEKYLNIPGENAEKVSPEPLLALLSDGNFGHYAPGRQDAFQRSALRRKADTLRRFVSRLSFSLRFAPGLAFSTFTTLVKGNLNIPWGRRYRCRCAP